MLALLSAWMGLACLAFAVVMIFYGPALNSVTIVVELWGAAAAMTVAGLVFWAHRNEPPTTAVRMQRLQAGFGIGLAIVAAAIVYVLIIGRSTPVTPAASGSPAVSRARDSRSAIGLNCVILRSPHTGTEGSRGVEMLRSPAAASA